MAGIWGVIERGGELGARMGLHEQLNVIRLRPSGSSWVIDNPAAFLPGSRLQTGGWLREGRASRRDSVLLPGVVAPSRTLVGPRPASQVQPGSKRSAEPPCAEPLRSARRPPAPSCRDRSKTGSQKREREGGVGTNLENGGCGRLREGGEKQGVGGRSHWDERIKIKSEARKKINET